MNNEYLKLGNNIRALRKAFGKSQLEMAMDLNINDSTISQYENAIQPPERDILLKIAKYFKITENELVYGDFSNLGKFDVSVLENKELNKKYFESMLPIICSDEALENDNFKKAYKIHIEFYNSILEEKDVNVDNVEIFLELYKKAYDEGVVEGIANILWWIMFEGHIVNMDTPYFNDMIDSYPSLNSKQIFEILHLNAQDDEYYEKNKIYERERLEYIAETEKDFMSNIKILKQTIKYSDLADYYIAFRYILGLYDNSLSFELNKTIGYEIANTFGQLGNKYVKKLISLYYKNKKK